MRKVRYNRVSSSEDPFHWGSIELFQGPNGGSIEFWGVRWNLFRGSIEPFGGFDRTFLGRPPISGHRFKTPCAIGDRKIAYLNFIPDELF